MYVVTDHEFTQIEFIDETDAMNFARDLMREYQAEENYKATVTVSEVIEKPICKFSTDMDVFTRCEKI